MEKSRRDLLTNLQNLPVDQLRQLVEFTKPTPPPAPNIQPFPRKLKKLFPPKVATTTTATTDRKTTRRGNND